ncbi:MAG: hypothetical protein H6688_01905 [Erysipelotrichaceae bacterium]|nr:hypothetical protein [Erysipelotrichaceae bacterium]
MKVKPSSKKMIFISLGITLFCGLLIFTTCISIFLFQEWNYVQWLIIGVYIATSISIFFISSNSYFYYIESKFLRIIRFKKVIKYPYADILWLDQSKGEKNGTITFVLKTGKVIYLIPDDEGLVYRAILKNSKNLLSKEEIIHRFPGIKL